MEEVVLGNSVSAEPMRGTNSWNILARPIYSMNFHGKQWKTLARLIYSMNLRNLLEYWLVPGDPMESHKFMEDVGQANIFHKFPWKNSE